MPSRQEGWKWIRHGVLAWALIIAALPRVGRASEDIVVIKLTLPSYSVTEGSEAWLQARQSVARQFYETHGDNYDFLVVLPTFTASLGPDAEGLHIAVRNDVRGTGKRVFDHGQLFGSRARLKAYIDMSALMPGGNTSTEWGAIVLAHEVAHQWSGQAGFQKSPSAPRSEELLGVDSTHWSFFLDSDASVLYGSDWEARGERSFESMASRRRYSALDLYLMGFLSPAEVGPVTLLSPSPEELHTRTDYPPLNGTRVSATSQRLSIEDIIRAEGPRLPDSGSSQKQFRAAFILLLPSGQSPTPAQLAYAESLRHAFENHFFFLTRGRGIFETDLVEMPPGPVASNGGVELGLSYLLSRQGSAGQWGTRPESSLRETQQAVEVLRLFLSSAGVPASLQRAEGWLEKREPLEVDGLARLSLATQGENPELLARLRAWLRPSGSVGLSPGYGSTLLDSALLGLALTQPPAESHSTPEVTRFLLEYQNADGGWPALPGGPSRFEPTALVLEYLARVPRTAAITAATTKAFQFFRDHRGAQGLFLDASSRVASTGWALTSLATWGQLTPSEAFSAKDALLSLQRPDGSWEGTVVDTALALRALRIVLAPNLTILPSDIQLSATEVTAGETVLATVRILNTGYAEARNVRVRAFDSSSRPLGAAASVAAIEAGGSAQVLLSLDTRQSEGSSQVFMVVDPEGSIDEGKESDNRISAHLFISGAPAAPDLFVQAGGVTVTPAAIDRLPAQVGVTAHVGNLGKTAAPPVDAVIRMGTQVLATVPLTLGAQSSQLVSKTVQINALQAAGVITVEVDPANTVPEPVETNNTRTVKLELRPGVDLRVTRLTAPASVNQGQDIAFQYELANGGTVEALSIGHLTILSGGGATIATIPLASKPLAAGGQSTGQLLWRANVAGALRAVLRVQHPEDLDPSNDTGSATFEVQPSSLPNLSAVTGSLTITPTPPLETQAATVGVSIRNGGQSQAQGFTVDFYLGVPEAGGTRFHREQVSALAPGATLALTGSLTLPQDAPESLYVVLDGAQAVSEFDEEDNQSFITISPVPIADLVISSADIRPNPAFPRENTSVPVTVSVMNAGGQRAEGIQVELLREGSNGSDEPIGQAAIPTIEPGQRGEAIITWNTAGLRGPQRLVAIINRGQTVPEQHADNNRAERQVSVQDVALALSEPYFSPNGDGIRDVTEISYRLAAEAPVEAIIEDAEGRSVRILTAPAASASSLSWDGRSTAGRIVPDGVYRIHVRTQAPAPETLLGTLTAVVDTNRTLLDGAELSSIELENLEGTVVAKGLAAALPDESGVVFYGHERGSGRCGLYRQPLGGAPARRLTPDGWTCLPSIEASGGLAVSPDAHRVAFHGRGTCPVNGGTCNTVELLSATERSILRVAMDDEAAKRQIDPQLPPMFSRDGARVYFVSRERFSDDSLIEEVRVDGTQRRTLARSPLPIVESSLAPEGDRLAVIDSNGALFFIGLPHGNRTEFLPVGTITGYKTQGPGAPLLMSPSQELRHGWMPSGEALAYSSPGLMVLQSGWETHLAVAPKLELKNATTGELRSLFEGPRYSRDFNDDRAAVAVNPVSGGTAFLYTPLMSTDPQLWTVSTSGTARMLLPYPVRAARWAPGGSFLFGFTDYGGSRSLNAIITRDNLFVRLTATRTPGSAGITFQGTVADRNFEEWQLGVRAYGASAPFVPVATSTTPVLNGLLTEWIPRAPGMYEAQLLARDRAGNVRTQTVVFGYSLSPAVANVSRSPELFSPNGDGVLDTVELRYTITRPTVAELQILDASNQIVRQQALLHEEARDFTLHWDGRDAQGQRVPDGEYTLSLDGTRFPVEVDITPPVVQLTLAETGGSGLPAPYRFDDVYVRPIDAAEPSQSPSKVRIVSAGTRWKVQDAHLLDWAFEVSSPQDPSVTLPLFTGTASFVEDRAIPIETLRGSFRLRAQDRAGNQALTPLLRLDDQLFVTLGGLPSFDGLWILPGQVMPHLGAGYSLAQADSHGTSVIEFTQAGLEQGHFAFGLNTTSGSRLRSFSIAYRSSEGPWIVDTQNVMAMGDAMVIWNATGAGPLSDIEIRALDENQQIFRAPVFLKPATRSQPESVPRFACVKTRGGEATVLLAYFRDSTLRPEHLAPGARWRFTAQGSEQGTDFPAAPHYVPIDKGTGFMQSIPTSALTQCQYKVEFLGRDLRSNMPVNDAGTVNLCKSQVTLSEEGISLSESFREAIHSAEVFVSAQGHEVVVARFGPFEGTSPVHPLDRLLLPGAQEHTLKARVTLANGERIITEPNLPGDDIDLLDPGCNDEDTVWTPQGKLALSPPSRDADAPLCGIHAPTYRSHITGQGDTEQTLQALSVEVVSAQGVVLSQPEIIGVTLGEAVVDAWVHIPAQSLPEGSHKLRATATWSDGSKTRAQEKPLFIDRTPANTVVTRPHAAGRVCPESRRRTNGVLEQYLVVEGTVADRHLESYELLLREPGGAPQRISQVKFNPSTPTSVQSVLGTIDLAPWGSDFELQLSARDVSGSSWCATPVTVEVATPPSVSALAPSPGLFSPNGDGKLDTTSLQFTLSQDVTVTITAQAGEAQPHAIFEGPMSMGTRSWTWNGLLPGGTRLADGAYTLRVLATGACGMTGETSTLVRLDTKEPVARIDFPAEGQALGASFTVTGQAADEHLLRYELSLGQGATPGLFTPISSALTAVSGVLGSVPLENLPNGEYMLRLVVEDKAGNSQQTLRRFVHQPGALLQAATVTPALISPDGDGVLDTASLSVQLAAPANVSVTLLDSSGQPVRVLVAPTSLPAQVSQLPITGTVLAGLSNGLHTLRVSADSGLTTETALASLEVDLNAPHVVVSSPVSGGVRGAHLTIEGLIEDPHLESWTLHHLAPGESGTGQLIASGNAATSGTLAVSSGLAEGTHRLVLEARDRAGHTRESSVSFTVDATPPVVSFLSPSGGDILSGRLGPLEIRGQAEDAHLHSVRLEATTVIGTETLFSGSSIPPNGLLHSWTVGYEADGPAELRLVAEDAAGNTSESLITLVLDSTPPVAALVEPHGATHGKDVAFRGSAADARLSTWELELGRGTPGAVDGFQRIASSSQAVSSGLLTTLASVGDGPYVARLRVRDSARNESVDEEAFTVDSIAPLPVPTLSANGVRPNTVTLSWEASPSSDVTAYEVFRAMGSGPAVLIATVSGDTRTYLDTGLPDGRFRYSIRARDAAGNVSHPSSEAQVEIDATPPVAQWLAPTPEERVRGEIELLGTAYSPSDFREYRVSIGAGSAPGSFTLLERSPLPVSAGRLGGLDVLPLPQGSIQTLRLEAEDLIGNVSEAHVTFTVDNLPPSAPVLNNPTVSGSNVALTWQATPEEDVLGFVIFRNGAPLGNPGNASPRDLRPYALPSTSRSYTDTLVPDGSHTYHLVAIDRAGNVSVPSNSRQASLNTRPPSARITEPAALERLRHDTWLVAHAEDQDIASIRFEARHAPDGSFAAVGDPVTQLPFTSLLSLSQLNTRVLELRAIARDSASAVDPSPASIHVLKEALPSRPSLSALVDGDQVQFSWTDTNPEGLLAGFELSTAGEPITEAPARWPGTASATTTLSGSSPTYAYDSAGSSTAWSPKPGFPQTWTLELQAPVLLRTVALSMDATTRLRLEARIAGFWVTLVREVQSQALTHPLVQPVEVEAVRVTLLGNISGTPALKDVTLDALPLEHGSSTLLSAVPEGQHTYQLRAMGFGGTPSEPSEVSVLIYAPRLEATVESTPESTVPLQGGNVPPSAQVELFNENGVAATTTADPRGQFVITAPLVDGFNSFQARATDGAGNRSLLSEPVTVLRDPAPTAGLTLALSGVNHSDVSLQLSVSGEQEDIAGYVLVREGSDGTVELPPAPASTRSFVDRGVRNGTYTYRAHAFNASGFRGPASNGVTAMVDIAPPAAPVEVVVTPLPSGGSLAVSWAPGDARTVAYRVERAVGAEGPFEVLANFERVITTRIVDLPLSNNTLYRYRILALDALGNISSPSMIASGTPVDLTPPAPPQLMRPTVAGKPVTVSSPTVAVSGLTEPGTHVTLLRDGVVLAEAPAGALSVESLSWELGLTPIGSGWPSADGQRVAYAVRDSVTRVLALAVESRSGELLGTFSHPSFSSIQEATFSPDGQYVAIQALSRITFQSEMFLAKLTSGEVRRASTATQGVEAFATWSPDSGELAYQVTRSSEPSAIAVVDIETGHTRWLTREASAPLMAPRYAPNGSWLFALTQQGGTQQLLRMNPESGASTSLFEAESIEPGYAVSPDSGRIALVATREGQKNLYTVSIPTGASVRLTQGAEEESFPAFSADGRLLAFKSGNFLVIHEEGSEQRFSDFSDFQLAWTPSGELLATKTFGLARLEWGARFAFTGVRLEPGDNLFSATAADAAQRTSAPAAPIQITLDSAHLPDLVAEVQLRPEAPRMGQPFDAFITVRNQGGDAAPATTVSVAVISPEGAPLPSKLLPLPALSAGGMTTMVIPFSHPELHGPQVLEALVDPEQRVEDPVRDNNRVHHPFSLAADDRPVVAVSVSPQAVDVDGESLATITVANPGGPRTVDVEVRLVTPGGESVFQLGETEHLAPLGAGKSLTFTRQVQVGRTLAGPYQVKAVVREGTEVLTEMGAPLTIRADRATQLRLATSRARYLPGETLAVTATVRNDSTNSHLTGASYLLTVTGPGNASVLAATTALPSLAQGVSHSAQTELSSLALPPGQYEARGVIMLGARQLASSTANFVIEGRALITGAISVVGQGTPPVVKSGQPLSVEFEVGNQGTATEPSVAIRVAIIDADSSGTVLSYVLPAQALEVGGFLSGQHGFSTAGLPLKSYAAYLIAERPNGTAQVLSSASFRLTESQGPTLEPNNFSDGMYWCGHIFPKVRVTDESGVVSVSARIVDSSWETEMFRNTGTEFDGTWLSSNLIDQGVNTLVFVATDALGNTRQQSFTLSFDCEPPEVTVTGVTDRALYKSAAIPVIDVQDEHLATALILLDGEPFTSGTAVTTDGTHELAIQATDRAGRMTLKSLRFTVDMTPPTVSISGVTEGGVFRQNVMPVVTLRDRDLKESSITLDGQPFVPGTVVTTEGAHTLRAQATDRAGNQTERQLTFTVDQTPPTVEISGVSNGTQYPGPVTPVITLQDTHLASSEARLNGVPFTSGTVLTEDGSYTLTVRAEDLAGWVTERSLLFSLQTGHVQLSSASFTRVLALVRAGTCTASASEVQRVQSFLEAELGGPERLLTVMTEEAAFLEALRSGVANVAVVFSLGSTGKECSESLAPQKPSSTETEALELRKAWSRELTEQVFSGHSGLVVIRSRPEDMPLLREVLGVEFQGALPQGQVQFPSSPLGGPAYLNLPAGGSILQALSSSVQPAAVYSEHSQKLAGALNTLGQGRSVTFGVDLTRALPAAHAALALRQAVAYVMPAPPQPTPLGVTGVELKMTRPARNVPLRVVETLPTALTALWASSEGTFAPGGHGIIWEPSQTKDMARGLRVLVRLPESPGNHALSASVTALRGSQPAAPATRKLELAQPLPSGELAARVHKALLLLRDSEQRTVREIEARLESVEARPLNQRSDIEANLDELFMAIEATRSMDGDTTQVRKALGDLLQYWEARWYLF